MSNLSSVTDNEEQAEKIEINSTDVVKESIAQLQNIFPHVFNEGHIDFTKLKAVFGEYTDNSPERYGLNWAGKRDAFRNIQVPSTATLRPQFEEGIDWNKTENLIIEGDNLEVLKLFQKSYHGKIKMIYIDPPYNTGNEFIYPDNFREGIYDYLRFSKQIDDKGMATSTNKDTSGRYHSNWLNMMYPRLLLARNLLKDDGVIFISIDDNEVHNLRLLMDEIFGEENFKGQITRATGTPTGQGTDRLVNEMDYIVVYSKSANATFYGLPFSEEDEKRYDLTDNKGQYLIRPLRKTGGEDKREDRPSMYYAVIAPDNTEVYPIGPGGYESRWRCSAITYQDLLSRGFIEWKKVNENGSSIWRPYQKFYMEGRTKQPSNLWTKIEGNKKASREVSELLGDRVFDFPKPVELIKKCCQISTSDDDIVLDFFAGSGTTAHAVLDLNNQDGANRKFILIQLPEKTDAAKYPSIADITRERVRRVISSIIKKASTKLEFSENKELDQGFRSFKLDSSNFKIWTGGNVTQSITELTKQLELYSDNVLPNRDEQDQLYEIILKSGLPVSCRIDSLDIGNRKTFLVENGKMIICLEKQIDREILQAIFSYADSQKDTSLQMIISLDSAFHGNDALKSNIVLEAQNHSIAFKTI